MLKSNCEQISRLLTEDVIRDLKESQVHWTKPLLVESANFLGGIRSRNKRRNSRNNLKPY